VFIALRGCFQVYDATQETYITFDKAMQQVEALEKQQQQQQQALS